MIAWEELRRRFQIHRGRRRSTTSASMTTTPRDLTWAFQRGEARRVALPRRLPHSDSQGGTIDGTQVIQLTVVNVHKFLCRDKCEKLSILDKKLAGHQGKRL